MFFCNPEYVDARIAVAEKKCSVDKRSDDVRILIFNLLFTRSYHVERLLSIAR